MNEVTKLNKKIITIVLVVFVLGITMQFTRSVLFLQLGIGNENPIPTAATPTNALHAESVKKYEQDRFLIIYAPEEAGSAKIKDNLIRSLKAMQKSYQVTTTFYLPNKLTAYKNIIFTVANLDKIPTMSAFIQYVAEGGSIFFAVCPELTTTLSTLYQKLGIYDLGDFTDTHGITFTTDVLLKGSKTTFQGEFLVNSSLTLQLKEDVEILAKSVEKTPLLWRTDYGQGHFMVFNGTMLAVKYNTGLISGALSYLNDDFIYPIINSKVFFIDDFPAPFPDGDNPKIKKKYNMDTATFFHTIWWRDMKEAAEKYDIKYTGVMIESYEDRVKPPFKPVNGAEDLKRFGRELIDMGGEIGLHGYNHQSLTMNQQEVVDLGYRAWPNEQAMIAALKEAERYLHEIFPGYPLRTYVPPSNILSATGKQAIQKAIPTIQNFASLYQEDDLKRAYVQEMEVQQGSFEIPRFTSGYYNDDENKWKIANAATQFGAFSHFIHPDDLLDVERTGHDDWENLKGHYDEIIRRVRTNYPWMRSMTATQSAAALKAEAKAQVYLSQKPNKIEGFINHFTGDVYFLLRTDKTVKQSTDCLYHKIDSDRYLIQATKNHFTFTLEEAK